MRKMIMGLLAFAVTALAMAAPAAAATLGDTLNHLGNFDLLGLGATLAVIGGAPLKDLQEKREQLVTQARAALDEINGNTDDSRTAELDQRHDAIMAEVDAIDGKIEREERMARIEQRFADRNSNRRPLDAGGEARGQGGGDDEAPTYRDAFIAMLREGGDASALEPELRSILRRGHVDTSELRTQTAGTTTAGGYTVPTELADFIIKAMKFTGPMYDPGVTSELTTSGGNPFKVPTVDDTAKSAGAHTEGAALTDDGSEDATFGQKSLDAYVFDTEFLKVSMELIADSAFPIESFIGGLLGERLGRVANVQLTTGSGSSAPNGIVTAASTGVTAASATAITWDELIDLEHSVDRAYREAGECAYMLHDSVLKVIRKLKDSEGRYIWQMGDVQKGIPGSLNGHRYHVNNAMASALAISAKTVLFGNLKKYYVRKVGAPMVGVLKERFWPDVGMAGLIRFDGELGDTGAVKLLVQAAS